MFHSKALKLKQSQSNDPARLMRNVVKHQQQRMSQRLLVGGFNPIEKLCSSNWNISPGKGKNEKH